MQWETEQATESRISPGNSHGCAEEPHWWCRVRFWRGLGQWLTFNFSSGAFEIDLPDLVALPFAKLYQGEGRAPHTSVHRDMENHFTLCSHLYMHVQGSLCRTFVWEAEGLDSAPGYFINCVCFASLQSKNTRTLSQGSAYPPLENFPLEKAQSIIVL